MAEANSITSEAWMDIPGFPRCQASDLGNIRDFWVAVYGYGGPILEPSDEPRPVLPTLSSRGYHCVQLRDEEGKWRGRQVHRLVLEAFAGPCPEGHVGCHRDDVRTHNGLSNLYWGTPTQNALDKSNNGKHWASKMTPEQVAEAMSLRKQGWSFVAIGKRYGVTGSSIQRRLVVRGMPQAYHRVGMDERRRIELLFALGFNRKQISERVGRQPSAVSRIVGFMRRNRPPESRRRTPFGDHEIRDVLDSWSAGESAEAIAERHGSTSRSIRQMVYDRLGSAKRPFPAGVA